MFRIYCLLIGYALGCIQSAYILCRAVGKIDIREYGSGNAGFTNTTRVLGKKVGAWVFVMDLCKVIVAYFLCSLIFADKTTELMILPGIYGGLGAVFGHNFPFYLGFRGGKGIACTLGLMLCVSWKIALITYAVGFVVFMAKKYISLASLTMAVLYPVIMIICGWFNIEAVILMFVLCVLAYIKHISNIKRLLNGTENKFGSKKVKVGE